MIFRLRKFIIALLVVLIPISLYYTDQIKFSFDFEQFFPENDPDLDFFNEFIDEFESDDNYLMIALPNKPSVFDHQFLSRIRSLSLKARKLPFVKSVQSLPLMEYPIKTLFGISAIPIIHIDSPNLYEQDRRKILNDDRFVPSLINKQANALSLNLLTEDALGFEDCKTLMNEVKNLLALEGFEKYHLLGRPYFTAELVSMQQREIFVSTVISGTLVTLILFFLFRRFHVVSMALNAIGLGLLFFMAMMGLLGRDFNAMAALYPVIMLIVGTSDVIHILTKYIEELRKGKDEKTAILITIRQIGLATLYTSLTTAAGFASLYTSNMRPIKDFGINAAMGVMIAYITVILLAIAVLPMIPRDKMIGKPTNDKFWDNFLLRWYFVTLKKGKLIALVSSLFVIICLWGLSKVSTNYTIESALPLNAKISNDFRYFEEEFSGFRPIEFAIEVKNDDVTAHSFDVLKEVNKLDEKLRKNENFNSVISIPTLYKSVQRMNNNNSEFAYAFPTTEIEFLKSKKLINRLLKKESLSLLNSKNTKTRISTRVSDIGADRIKKDGIYIDNWINSEIDTSIVSIKRTGSGLLIDKNAEFIRKDLLTGLILALTLVSLLMIILFKNWRMLFIALIPNIIPIIFAAALLGFFQIELEAGISIVFAVVFGIAVDDTIHFLSKYKLVRQAGHSKEESIRITFLETGKAISYTTIILIFGFLVMLFSVHPPSVIVGILISVTLVSAWIGDLMILPPLIRKFL